MKRQSCDQRANAPRNMLICTLSHHVPSGQPSRCTCLDLPPPCTVLPAHPAYPDREAHHHTSGCNDCDFIKISGSITLGKSVTPLGPSVSHEPWPLSWMPVLFVWVSLLSNQGQSCPWSGHSAPVGGPGRSCVQLGSPEKQDRQGL